MKPILEANDFARVPNLMVMEVILSILEFRPTRVQQNIIRLVKLQ